MKKAKLNKTELEEIRSYIKKLRKEGSTTAGVGAYQTPAAFTGNEDGEGTEAIDLEDDQYAYSEKPSKKKMHYVKLHEVSYKTFKEDATASEVQKINKKILEVNKRLREISQALDHSIKLKNESSLDDSAYWKRTNEAILKISKRLSEVNKKARKLANLKELAASSVKDKLIKMFNKAGIPVKAVDVEYNQIAQDVYEFDIFLNGEPYGVDYKNGELFYQDFDREVRLGNINQEADLIKNILQYFGNE